MLEIAIRERGNQRRLARMIEKLIFYFFERRDIVLGEIELLHTYSN